MSKPRFILNRIHGMDRPTFDAEEGSDLSAEEAAAIELCAIGNVIEDGSHIFSELKALAERIHEQNEQIIELLSALVEKSGPR